MTNLDNNLSVIDMQLLECKNKEKHKLSKVMNKIEELQEELMTIDNSVEMLSKVKEKMKYLRLFYLSLSSMLIEMGEASNLKNKITSILGCDPSLVSRDQNELEKSNGSIVYHANDFKFDATIVKKQLKNLTLIWGDADLRALIGLKEYMDSGISYTMGEIERKPFLNDLTNIDSVWGSLYLNYAQDLKMLSNIRIVGGDLHIESLKDLTDLRNVEFIGGSIYTKEGIYSFEQFKEIVSTTKQKNYQI